MKKLLSVLLALSLSMTLAVGFAGCKKEEEPKTPAFVKPENYFSVVEVTINPTLNLYLDKQNVVLAVEYVNKDAEDTYKEIETDLVGKDLKDCVNKVVEKAAEKGFLEENKQLTINIAQARDGVDENSVLTAAVKGAKEVIEDKKLETEITVKKEGTKVDSETFEEIKDETPDTSSKEEPVSAESKPESKPQAPSGPTTLNPQTALKNNAKYRCYIPRGDGMLDVISLTLKKDEMSYSLSYYTFQSDEPDWQYNVTVKYNGKTWYEAGGKGGGGVMSLTAEEIVLAEENVTLVFNSNNELTVSKVGGASGDFKVGYLFVAEEF